MNNCFVYRHVRIDNNTVFYIGIGSHKTKRDIHTRAYSKSSRNKHWKNITAKTSYTIDILVDNISWETACLKEQEFIKIYGREIDKTGTLCNLTIGGDGILGFSHNLATKAKMRKAAIGKIISPEQRAKARLNSLGNKNTVGYKHSEEFKAKCRQVNTGKKMSEEAKKKIGDFWRGKPRTDEVKKKLSEKLKGHTFTEESKEKIRQTLINAQLPIKQINKDGEVIAVFKSVEEAAIKLNRSFYSIKNALRDAAQKRQPSLGYFLSRKRA